LVLESNDVVRKVPLLLLLLCLVVVVVVVNGLLRECNECGVTGSFVLLLIIKGEDISPSSTVGESGAGRPREEEEVCT
jgi:hypothetical protein